MATDKLINSTQGDDIIDALNDIADNVGNITYGPQTSSDKVVSMLGYAEAAEAASINPGDTLNVAIGKLEKKANDNATNVANKIDKLTNATAGDIATVTATGEIADSTVSIADSNTGLADSDTAVPTSKTVKTYVDSTATGISRYLGTITAANQLSTSAKKGDFYVVKTAWTGVHAGDEIIAEKDGPAQTIDGTNWSLLHNEADTDTKYQFGEGTTNGTFLVTPSDTGTAQSVPIKGLGSAAYTTADTSSLTNDNNHVPTSALAKSLLDAKVPTTRKVNNKALASDITLSASDVSAVPSANVTTTLPASSAAASTSKVMSEKLVYDNYVQNSDFVVATNNLKYILNNDRKNLCTRNGEPWSSNTMVSGYFGDDGTLYVSTSGAITANSNLYFADIFLLQAGVEYKFGLCPGSGPVRLALVNATGEWVANQFGTTPSTYTPSATGKFSMYVYIYSGTNITNHPITPMICPSEVWDYDSTYVQPARTNAELTVLEAEDRAALAEELDAGAKNLVQMTWTNADPFPDIHMTKNSDGSISVTATNTTAVRIVELATGLNNYLTAGKKYVVSGCDGGDYNNHYGFALSTSNYTGRVFEADGSEEFTYASEVVNFTLIVRAGESWTKTFKPMICTKAAFAVSPKFVPYKPNPFEVIRGSIDFAVDVADANTVYVTQIGRIVNIQFAVKFTNAIPNSETIVGTIKGVGLPVYTTRIMISQNSELFYPAEAIAYGMISSNNGTLAIRTLQATPATMKAFFFSISYTCKE